MEQHIREAEKKELMHFFVDIYLYVVVINFLSYNILYLFSLERRKDMATAKQIGLRIKYAKTSINSLTKKFAYIKTKLKTGG
jgi:hypothetical protein